MEYIEALEAATLFTAAMLPYLKKSGRRAVIERVSRTLRRHSTPRQRYETIYYDPEAASEFFAARGMKVVKKESDEKTDG